MRAIHFTISLLWMLKKKMLHIGIFSIMINLGVAYYYPNFKHKVSEARNAYFKKCVH